MTGELNSVRSQICSLGVSKKFKNIWNHANVNGNDRLHHRPSENNIICISLVSRKRKRHRHKVVFHSACRQN